MGDIYTQADERAAEIAAYEAELMYMSSLKI